MNAAIADFSRAVALDPDPVLARYWRGYVADKTKDRAAAIADYSWVIEHHPEIVSALIVRGKALMNRGELDRAIADFDRADGRPGADQTSVWIYRAWCLAANGQHDRAIADYSRAIDKSGVSATWVYMGRARSYRATGDHKSALHDLDEALSLQPQDVSVHGLRAEIHMEMGDNAAVAREADQLRRLIPNQPGPYFLRSVALWLTAGDLDRKLAEIIQNAARIEQAAPCIPAPGLVRDLAAAIPGIVRKGALADVDRCLALEPRLSLGYAARAIFNAQEGRLVASIPDAARFCMLFDAKNYRLLAKLDRKNRRFYLAVCERQPQKPSASTPKGAVADLGREGINLGFQRLLASAFASGR